MESISLIKQAQKALKLINQVEDSSKLDGLKQLSIALDTKDPRLNELGYDHMIFMELIKLLKFESGDILIGVLGILEKYYFSLSTHHDELAESLLYRYGLSSDLEVNKICLESLSHLIDNMDDGVAKHSKQIINVADLNTISELNAVILELLTKIKNKLPKRIDYQV